MNWIHLSTGCSNEIPFEVISLDTRALMQGINFMCCSVARFNRDAFIHVQFILLLHDEMETYARAILTCRIESIQKLSSELKPFYLTNGFSLPIWKFQNRLEAQLSAQICERVTRNSLFGPSMQLVSRFV